MLITTTTSTTATTPQEKSERVRLRRTALSLIIGSFLVLGVLAHANVTVCVGQSSAGAGF